MELPIQWSDKGIEVNHFKEFWQKCANRLIYGHHRYGKPNVNHKYLTRLKLELKAYEKTGNADHLYNIANYCNLEIIAPEHKKHHLNVHVDSVTRSFIKDFRNAY